MDPDAGVLFLSTAEFPANLNRRRQAALCAMLVCVGLILLLGGKVRDAAGITLLGMAFSWALGSNNRLVHWLFVICGLLLLVIPVGDGFLWPRQKPELIKGQTSLVESDRGIVESTNALITQMTQQEQRETREDLSKLSSELAKDEVELQRMQTEGIFRHVMRDDWANVAGGLLLLSAGLGLMVGVKPVRSSDGLTV